MPQNADEIVLNASKIPERLLTALSGISSASGSRPPWNLFSQSCTSPACGVPRNTYNSESDLGSV